MHRDLLDALRCPGAHEESWLVVMVHDARDAMLTHAELACPLCGAEYAVRGAVTDFRADASVPGSPLRILHELEVSRHAALLGMTQPTQSAVVFGHPDTFADVQGVVQATLQVGDRLPLGAGTMAAALLDASHATPGHVREAVRVVRTGGRIVAPASVPLPDGVRELARDETEWVAEVTAQASGLITLRRRPPDIAD